MAVRPTIYVPEPVLRAKAKGTKMLRTLKSRVTTLAGRSALWTPSVLIVLSHAPFDGDTTWNALRLAGTLVERRVRVRIFVMNDAPTWYEAAASLRRRSLTSRGCFATSSRKA